MYFPDLPMQQITALIEYSQWLEARISVLEQNAQVKPPVPPWEPGEGKPPWAGPLKKEQ